ncbi:F-box family protein [Actinidia rufa]|uniref:F-box family protein n=1 Tax=Actinidia rufa TaxID=165716 RepID=A0A7J0EHE2_9ERIC|nr:F-box family protein [Actinidia rufa]
MDASPIYRLPQDTLHQIFSALPLSQIVRCRSVCKFFNHTLTSPSFLHLLSAQPPPPPLRLLSLCPPSPPPTTTIVGPTPNPIAPSTPSIQTKTNGSDSPSPSSPSGPHTPSPPPSDSIESCPSSAQLGRVTARSWSARPTEFLVLSELAALYFSGSTNNWVNFSSNLPSKPRSPILVSDLVLALCDVGSPWRSQWKLFSCTISTLQSSQPWSRLEKHEWGDVFDILKRPRLVKGIGNRVFDDWGFEVVVLPERFMFDDSDSEAGLGDHGVGGGGADAAGDVPVLPGVEQVQGVWGRE